MNLEESDIFKAQMEKKNKQKNGIILLIVICFLLIITMVGVVIYIKYEDSITLKLFIDKKQVAIPNELFIEKDGKRYLNLYEIASLVKYEYNKGLYGGYNEDENSCYIKNDFETIAITAGENHYVKYITMSNVKTINNLKVTTQSENGYSEEFIIDEPAELINGNLYVLEDYIPKMFNMSIKWEEYRIIFSTLEYKISSTQKSIAKYNYTELNSYFENLKAIIDGYAVVGNGSKKYGIVNLSDGGEIISIKYDNIKYVQNAEEFYVTTEDNTMGLLDSTGDFIIPPLEYEKISLLDDFNQLYLVEKNGEYGVLNRNGDVIAYPENDAIGYDVSAYNTDVIDNNLLWFDKCIPVMKNSKYGLYDKDGSDELLLPINYEGFGYYSNEPKTSGNQQSVLFIPESVGIKGIVIKYNNMYGIFDVNKGSIILTCVFTKIYSITKSGTTTYYLEYNDEEIELSSYLEELNLKSVDSSKYIKENEEDEDFDTENNYDTEDSYYNESNINNDYDNSEDSNEDYENEDYLNNSNTSTTIKKSINRTVNNTSDVIFYE